MFLLPLSFYVTLLGAVPPRQSSQAKLLAPDGAFDEQFGYSTAADNGRLISGAWRDDGGAGAAYVYRWQQPTRTWELEQKVIAPDRAANDHFAFRLALDQHLLAVGAPHDDDRGTSSGAAYLYSWNEGTLTWTLFQKLVPPDLVSQNEFGYGIDILGDWLVVGARGYNNQTGAAYFFQFDTLAQQWVQKQKVSSSAQGDVFGEAVAMAQDFAAVGAPNDDDFGTSSGSVFIYRRSQSTGQWTFQRKLNASDGAAEDYFGQSLEASAGFIIVGCLGDDTRGNLAGAAYIYHYDGALWTQEQKLLGADTRTLDLFGQSVSIDGPLALVGAYQADGLGSDLDNGAAYLFERNDTGYWTQREKLTALDGASFDHFGYAVSISQTQAICGAPFDEDLSAGSGSAYAFRVATIPTAAFDATPLSGLAPLEVTFSDLSTGEIDTWLWTFGDGATSAAQNPVHAYASPGAYTVSLEVTGIGGYDALTRIQLIAVLEDPPIADFFGAPTSGEASLAVAFNNQTSGMATGWLWDFGDGQLSSQQSPLHVYTVPGTYSVTLTSTGPGGSSTLARSDYIVVTMPPPPTASFDAFPRIGIAPLVVNFVNDSTGSILFWNWDFGDGTDSSLRNPTHVYLYPGAYTVTLTAVGPGGAAVETRSSFIRVLPTAGHVLRNLRAPVYGGIVVVP